jgi:hypothetical protein
LDALAVEVCEINARRFVDALGANAFGPRDIQILDYRTSQLSYDSSIVPLLKIPRMRSLELNFAHCEDRKISDVSSIKAAFESNVGLKELRINGGLKIPTPAELMLLFKGIASAPKLRHLELALDGTTVSPQE